MRGDFNHFMKHLHSLITAGALVPLLGCVSPQNVTSIAPVGPPPSASSTGLNLGCLRVYSARTPAHLDPEMAERLWDEDVGANDFSYGPGYTDYSVYSATGRLLERIHNATEPNAQPALVTLTPGFYRVNAREQTQAGGTMNVTVPVEVAPGKCTVLHLEGDWRPSGHYGASEVVRLPDGRIAGWRAPGALPQLTKHPT